MKQRTLILLLILPILLLTMTKSAAAQQEESSGYCEFWHVEELQFSIAPTLGITLGKEFKYRGGSNYCTETGVSINYLRQEKPDITLGYKIIDTLVESGWVQENRVYADYTPQWKIGDVELSDRNRFEYRFFHYDTEDYLRYRNRLELAIPLKIRRLTIKPYIAGEVFFDRYSGGAFAPSKNQYSLGIRNDMREHLHIDISLIRQTNARYLDEGELLDEFNALQVKLKFQF
ncbi:MAG: DUF2490 domain-containing protein [Vulcanimicrobiota bacterium]